MLKIRLDSRGSALILSDVEGLHSLVGDQKQNVQDGVTWSDSEFMICNQSIGEKEGFVVNCDDGFHDLADDWK